MKAVKNGILASCIAYVVLFIIAVINDHMGRSELAWIFGMVVCIGLITWSLSGRKKIEPPSS